MDLVILSDTDGKRERGGAKKKEKRDESHKDRRGKIEQKEKDNHCFHFEKMNPTGKFIDTSLTRLQIVSTRLQMNLT